MLYSDAISFSGLITLRKNLTAAFFSNSRAVITLSELSNSITSRIGDSARYRSLISASLPSIFSSKSLILRLLTLPPAAVNTDAGMGTRADGTFTTSVSSSIGFGTGVGDVVAAVVWVGVYMPTFRRGVGDGVGPSAGLI